MKITIKIDEVFEGDLSQWEEEMYPFRSLSLGEQLESVISHCAAMDWEVDIECRLENESIGRERLIAKVVKQVLSDPSFRNGPDAADFSARQIVDDLYRKGIDVRFQQHIIEGVLRAVLEKE